MADSSALPHQLFLDVEAAVLQVVRGNPGAVRLSLATILARGHLLLEDVPGVGKTTLARALAKVLGVGFSRVQFTADLLPSDLVGVPILDALDIVARASGNIIIAEGIQYARRKVSEGKTLAEPLADTKLFPSMVCQMVSIGESAGALDTMLNKIADFYEDEVDAAVAGLTSLLEPLIMVFLAIVLGGFLIAMYLPIFTIAGSIS